MAGRAAGWDGPLRPGPTSGETGDWVGRLAARAGPVDTVHKVSASVWRVATPSGDLAVKTGSGVGDEAEGLRLLAQVPSGPSVPEVVVDEGDLLALRWIDQGGRSPSHEEALGRQLGMLHGSPWKEWGGGSSWIGRCRVDPAPTAGGVELYRRRLKELAKRCGLSGAVERVAERLEDLFPPGGPARVHGDLWWGNVLWGRDGRPWLIDPSFHGGHPEEDLAMLGLFGSVPERTLRAYREVAPLVDGWEERVDLFRLVPLLVHAVLFGGGYVQAAEAAARCYR